MTEATDEGAVDTTRPLSAFEERLRAWQATSDRRFEAKLAANDVLELQMLDSIGFDWWSGGGITSKSVQAKLDANKTAKTIKLLLHSGGGDAFEGLAIQAILKRHGARIEVEIVGLAASAASVIAMAGDTISMHEGALMMIHAPWTCMCGDSGDMRSTADFLDKVNASALAVYARRTGRPLAEIAPLVADETWMTAQEAVDAKFATSVIAGTTAQSPAPKARAAAQVFMSMRQPPRAQVTPVVATEPQPTTPAPVVRAEQQTPTDTGKENKKMAENKAEVSQFVQAITLALGLPVGSTESDVLARASFVRDFEKEAVTLTGVQSTAEAVGAIRGLKSKADLSESLQTELTQVKSERDKQNFETLLVKGKADNQLVPATIKLYEDEFAAALAEGSGSQVVSRLKGFLAVQPRVLPQQARQVAAGTTSGPLLWNNKSYSDLKPVQRARLSQEDPDLYREMKRDFDANQSA